MTQPTAPLLPTAQIRAALDAGQWEAAASLLTEHEAALRACLGSQERPPSEALLALLQAQRSFLSELTSARDASARALGQAGRDRRGAQAYLEGGQG